MADRLSSNSYAVLGMLALRPWTPYELTQQFLRSLTYCWPVSERLLYTEPEKLVTAGLAEVRTSADSARERRQYEITDAGREALRSWLATAPALPRIFNEPLLRVLFADQGETGDLLNGLVSLRSEIDQQIAAGRAQVLEYLEDRAPFPERAHLIALFADLNNRILTALDEWADDAANEVSKWPTTKALGLTPSAKRRLKRSLRPADQT